MMWWYGYPDWWGIGMILVMVLFWGGLIALIVWAVRRFSRGGRSDVERKGPLDIAKERYARGEITREEFENIKKDLQD